MLRNFRERSTWRARGSSADRGIGVAGQFGREEDASGNCAPIDPRDPRRRGAGKGQVGSSFFLAGSRSVCARACAATKQQRNHHRRRRAARSPQPRSSTSSSRAVSDAIGAGRIMLLRGSRRKVLSHSHSCYSLRCVRSYEHFSLFFFFLFSPLPHARCCFRGRIRRAHTARTCVSMCVCIRLSFSLLPRRNLTIYSRLV